MKDLYDKNFKSFKKDIEEDIRKLKDLPNSWIGRINIIKMAILPKAIYRIQCSTHQNSNTILHRHQNNNTQLHMEKRKTQDSQNNTVQ